MPDSERQGLWWRRATALRWHTFEDRPPGPALLVVGDGLGHLSQTVDTELFDDPGHLTDLGFDPARQTLCRIDAERRPELATRLVPAAARWPVAVPLDTDGRLGAPAVGARGIARLLCGQPIAAPPITVADLSIRTVLEAHAQIGLAPLGRAPRAPLCQFLLRHPDPRARPAALAMLAAMAQSGIRDQLDGGFHRAASDEAWVVPSFEKRAVDQAALLQLYLAEPAFHWVARGIVDYLERRLLVGDEVLLGEAADLGAYDDASHYTWTEAELAQVLDGELRRVAIRAFDVYGRGELRSDPTRNVLFVAVENATLAAELGHSEPEIDALLFQVRKRLLTARDLRPRPPLDGPASDGTVAAICLALTAAAAPLGRPDLAKRAAQLRSRLARLPVGPGHLADHALIGLALIGHHPEAAKRRADRILDEHDDGAAGFRDVPNPPFGHVQHPVTDGVLPSANALAGQLLVAVGTPDAMVRAARLAKDLIGDPAHRAVHTAGLQQLALATGADANL